MKHVKRTLMLNCYPKWMIQNKKKKQQNRFSEFISGYFTVRNWPGRVFETNYGETLNELSSNLQYI